MISPKKTLQRILKGKTTLEQEKLDEYFLTIPNDPNILWYPCAGDDFNVITELSEKRANFHHVEILPDLYFFNDYSIDFDRELPIGTVFNDGKSVVTLNEKVELMMNPDENIPYFVNPDYISFPGWVSKGSSIYLLNVTRKDQNHGSVNQWIIYFNLENTNLFSDIILKYKLRISHFVKIREGCNSEGGNKVSVAYVFNFLSVLQTQYILNDLDLNHNSYWDSSAFRLADKIEQLHGLKLFDFKCIFISNVPNWYNTRKVYICKIEHSNDPLIHKKHM